MFDFFKKRPIVTSLPFQVDIHSHLLPGIDDGVKTVEETVYILKSFQKLGYKKIITTPHVMSDYYPNTEDGIISKLAEVKNLINKFNLNIELEAAAEYYLDENLISKLTNKKKLLTFGENFLLFETSFYNKPAFLEEAIFSMNTSGYQPIMAHPERYSYLEGDQELLEKLKSMNLLFQMNILSLTGFYSAEVKRFAIKLLKNDMIDFVGTDCHNAHQVNEISNQLNSKNFRLLTERKFLNPSLL